MKRNWIIGALVLLIVLCGVRLAQVPAYPFATAGDAEFGPPAGAGEEKASRRKPSKKKKKTDEEDFDAEKPKKKKYRWGQRRDESDEEYDKRYARLLKRVKLDKRGDFSGGHFENAKGEKIRLWTFMGHPFLVRSDISQEFTADAAMYMEMLHRDFGRAYKILLGKVKIDSRPVEVIIFADRAVYMKNGGTPGSGGFFMAFGHFMQDRGPHWPARHFRLVQFTDGVTDFAKWPKGVLKHESAHMELQLRLGFTSVPVRGRDQPGIGLHIECPRWFNEGQAAVFEYWDFDKTPEENLEDIPNRGRYAPVIRRIHGTDDWKEFHYVWTIDPQTWHRDMTSRQGFLNYAQAWSLCAYMMHDGVRGRKDFQSIFDLSRRVGTDYQTTYMGDRTRAWEEKFPEEKQQRLEKNWNAWVKANLPRDKQVPDEDWYLKRMGYKPDVVDRLEPFTQQEFEKMRPELDAEEERRKEEIEVEK